MSDSFPAWLISKVDDGQVCERRELTTADLMDGDVTVRVEWSGLNYKDGLAITGSAPIARRFPLIPGIDFAGTVIESGHAGFKAGDPVLLTGHGVGEAHHGGFAARARVPGDWLIARPDGLSARQAMTIGTAGFTAMLCVMALEHHGVTPDSGELLLTGAAGGVGSVALALLSRIGFRVMAVTGRPEQAGYLTGLGAAGIVARAEFAGKRRPLAKQRWAAAIDVAGGNTLANVLGQIHYGGAVAACGLAESMALPASVAPFILRGVTLYGIDSVYAPTDKRTTAWRRLAAELDTARLDSLSQEVGFDDLSTAAEAILAGRVRGRTVVRIPS